MSTIAELIEPIAHSPFLPEIVEELNLALAAERARRRAFYAEMTDEFKMEFIDGEIVMHSPARNVHLIATNNLFVLLHFWVGKRDLGEVRSEKCLCVFPRNDYEPDLVFFSHKQAANFTRDTMKFPPPEFVVEVLSESTESRDRGVKFQDYEAHGAREYWIIDAANECVEQYIASNGRFALALKSGSGEIVSAIVTGFRIPIRAIFDPAENKSALLAMMSA